MNRTQGILESRKCSVREVLAWASLFQHHLTDEQMYHNLRLKMNLEDMHDTIGGCEEVYRKGKYVLSTSYSENEDFEKWKANAQQMRQRTEQVLAILASCKMVTGLAITGSVAAGVARDDGDLDVLIITKKNWVWRVRSLSIYLAHCHENGNYLCPNMVMDENSLQIEPSMYAARELMQIIPIKDSGGLTNLYAMNKWAQKELPNAKIKPQIRVVGTIKYPWWWKVMRVPILGRIIESWEANRRIKELTERTNSTEIIYSRSVCRGHENEHKTRIEKEYSSITGGV